MSLSLMVLTNPWTSRIVAVKESAGGVKIEQLGVHGRPIDQLSGCSVFTECFVIREPNPSAKLAMDPQDQQLVHS